MANKLKSVFCTLIFVFVIWMFIIFFIINPASNKSDNMHPLLNPTLDFVSNSFEFTDLMPSPTFEKIPVVSQEPKRTQIPLERPKLIKPTIDKNFNHLMYEFSSIVDETYINSSLIESSKADHDHTTLQLSIVKNQNDQLVRVKGYEELSYNLLVSNRIGVIRPLPSFTYSKFCNKSSQIQFQSQNTSTTNYDPTVVSVVICYYNEAPSALLRTIYSTLLRSPTFLLKEIIVIDDCSDEHSHFKKIQPLINSTLVKFYRTAQREGLIRARLFGVRQARGEVLVFLDSHVEPNNGWLEPLVSTVIAEETTIACPMIDVINSDTLIYTSSPMVVGGTNWALQFKWDSIPSEKLKKPEDFVKLFESPTMAGGIFAIKRRYFHYIGEYDSMMDLWGGENIELSLRVWMCGGKIKILPCSRVGHIFRKRRPYGHKESQQNSLLVNSIRTARVWLNEEYLEKFYNAQRDPKFARSINYGDINSRLALKEQLKCKNFEWYLQNVYPRLNKLSIRSSDADDSFLGATKKNLFRIFNNFKNNTPDITKGVPST